MTPNLLAVSGGPTHIVVVDPRGTRAYGLIERHDPRALRELDAWLDSLDACNEGPDGRIARAGS